MKKTIIFIVMAAYATGCLQAQDTLLLSGPHAGYYSTYWPVNKGDTIVCIGIGPAVAYYRYTDDTLAIYGIAASLEPQEAMSVYTYADTSLDNVFTTLRLYKRKPSHAVCQLGEDLEVRFTQPPTFYMELEFTRFVMYQTYSEHPVYPVYERYFDTPVTVTDSFYVGFDSPMVWDTDGDHTYAYSYGVINGFVKYGGQCYFNLPNIVYLGGYWDGDTNANLWSYDKKEITNPYIFPILTPPDTTPVAGDTLLIGGDSVIVCDTLIVGGDTIVSHDTLSIHDFVVGTDSVLVGDSLLVVTDTIVIGGDTVVVSDTLLSVMQPDMLQRLTGVMPSPARDRARVVSSVGLTGVDVYSLTGRRVHTLRLTGSPLSATLDVSRWPAGTYLLRITTPMGTTMKKLTVTR